jgi:hypothetical protein
MTIQAPPFDLVTVAGIAALAWVVAGAWVWIFGRRDRRLTIGLAAGALTALIVSAALAASGWLQRMHTVPPPIALMIAAVIAGAFALGLSRFGANSAREVPLVALVAFQSFRLPLELVMHRAALLGIMPTEFSYSGYNFDIVSGASALLLSLAMAAGLHIPRAVLWTWNLWGSWCLAVLTFLAIATSPMVRLFGDGPHVTTWVMFAPYCWLPVVLVTAALFGHIVMTRALLLGRAASGESYAPASLRTSAASSKSTIRV